MTKEQFQKLFNAVSALGYSDKEVMLIFYKQDLISWR